MSYWAVIRTTQGGERLALALVSPRFETFWPKTRVLYETAQGARSAARWCTIGLFANYMFVRIEDYWQPIRRSPGVSSLVMNGSTPARCPDAEIAKLIERADADWVIRLGPRRSINGWRSTLAPGSKVTITAGPLAGFDGLYAGQSASDRELILLTILGAQRAVQVSPGLIAARP